MQQETPSSSSPTLIASKRDLEEACARWRDEPVVALDTEFVRTRTFYPRLGLVQVADSAGCHLIDAVAIPDLRPLLGLIDDRDTLKVLHSCGEDLEIFYHLFETFPRPVFDTQIAATLAGYGSSLGYQSLVRTLLHRDLPKEETRSNWLQRPLTPSQTAYAAEDVAYLLPVHARLQREVEQRGRSEWMQEEVERLEQGCRFNLDPRRAYLRIRRAASLPPRQLAILQALSRWREQEARDRDLPRNFVIKEKVLLALATEQPTHPRQLAEIPELSPGERRRSGAALLWLIREARDLPAKDLPRATPPRAPSVLRKRLLEGLRRQVRRRADELDLPPEFLVQRRVLSQLVKNVELGEEEPLPPELSGWRRQVIGDELLEKVRSSLA